MKKKVQLTVSFNDEDIPILLSKKRAYLTFNIVSKRGIQIIGNKIGLKLMARALLGLAECNRTDEFHVHLDDIYAINEEGKFFEIQKE